MLQLRLEPRVGQSLGQFSANHQRCLISESASRIEEYANAKRATSPWFHLTKDSLLTSLYGTVLTFVYTDAIGNSTDFEQRSASQSNNNEVKK